MRGVTLTKRKFFCVTVLWFVVSIYKSGEYNYSHPVSCPQKGDKSARRVV